MSGSHTSDQRRALVVDDMETNRLLAARMLARAGWTVAEVEDGASALAWLGANEVELILLDISMPEMSGQETCRRIRESGLGGPGLRIAAYTAHAMPEDADAFLKDGFDIVLVKPIGRKNLAETLEQLGFGP